MTRRLHPWTLTFLAEALGRREPAPLRWLELLAGHKDPLVREGAIYGLARHVDVPRVREVLEVMSKTDANPEIRTAASEAIEAYE
jgi:hypothetical protein